MSPPPASTGAAAPDEPHRLPRAAVPGHYRIHLDVDLEAARFEGTVEISLDLVEPVESITLNAAELEIAEASLELGGERLAVTVALDEESERAVFALGRVAGPGPGVLRCAFAGVLNDKLRGLYRSTYLDGDGVTQTIAASQCESTDARRAFPCFDEPDRKAVFEISLGIDPAMAAYSNGPAVEETIEESGRKVVRFAPTMVMSSYLVAMIVGPLEATDPVDVDGIPVRVVHVPGKAHLAPYALEVAAHALRFFAEYFGIAYPAEKLDLVALPDFAYGAMENLGCVTFRETALLVDEAAAARADLERVADVVSHELAHMWFGDLVTMRWWEGIWLNEAFATFMEVLAVDAFRPGWQRWVSFGLSREAALAVDGLHSTRPIEYPVGSPDEAEGMFDVLTYQKGGSVLRMLEQYLGAETFRDGVRRYLTTHSYANTVTADLWDALEAVSGRPVRTVMDSWILQGGHPVVSHDGDAPHPGSFRLWRAPGNRSDRRALVGPRPGPLARRRGRADGAPRRAERAAPGGPRPGRAQRRRLGRLPDRLRLRPARRAGGGTRCPRAPRAGQPVRRHLGARPRRSHPAGRLPGAGRPARRRERPRRASPPWPARWRLCDRAADDGSRPAVAGATRALLGPRLEALGWAARPGEDERIPNLRALLIATLGTIGADESVRAEAAGRLDAAAAGGPPVDPDLEAAVLDVVAAARRPGDYDAFYSRYRDAATPQEELRYLSALGAFPDTELGTHTLSLALGEVRTQNAPYLIAGLLANRVAGPAVFERLTEQWDDALERFPVNSHARMLQGVRALCGDQGTARRVTEFLAAHPLRAPGSAAWTRPSSGSGSTSASSIASAPGSRRRCVGPPAASAAAERARGEPRRRRHRVRPHRAGRAPRQDDDRQHRHGEPRPPGAGVDRVDRRLRDPRRARGGGGAVPAAAPPPRSSRRSSPWRSASARSISCSCPSGPRRRRGRRRPGGPERARRARGSPPARSA